MKKYIQIILLSAGSHFLNAQVELPKIIGPSPEAAAFQRYGEIPVDYSTGVPRIEIPIHTITSRKLQLPVTISYHASGIKVNDISSTSGLGWVLNAGGIVTRTILGEPDDHGFKAVFKTKAEKESSAANEAANIFGQKVETDYDVRDRLSDRFYFQLPNGKSGTFRYRFDTGHSRVADTDEMILVCNSPVKIQKLRHPTSYKPLIEGFIITDEDGTKYYFDVKECSDKPDEWVRSSWYLSKIVSADNQDEIVFTYKNYRNEFGHLYYTHSLNWFTVNSDFGMGDCNNISPPSVTAQSSYDGTVERTSCIPLLDKISSATTEMVIGYANDRQDGPTYRIGSISVFDKLSGVEEKRISFQQSYFGNTPASKRLKLDGVTINNSSSLPERYFFEYYGGTLPEYPFKAGSEVFAEDYWGYANGGGGFIPGQYLRTDESSIYKGYRHPNPFISRAGMLNAVHYPTGGKTVYEFERHWVPDGYDYYNDVPTDDLDNIYGGFRVKSIKNYSKDNQLILQKTYEYKHPVYTKITRDLFWYSQIQVRFKPLSAWDESNCFLKYLVERAFSTPLKPIEPVMYQDVIEYFGTEGNNTGKIEYQYDIPRIDPLLYGYATGHYEAPRFIHNYQFDEGNPIPRLVSKTYYARKTGGYRKVRQEENIYNPYRSNVMHTGVHVVKEVEYFYCYPPESATVPTPGYNVDPNDDFTVFSGISYPNTFVYFDAKGYDKIYLLDTTRVTEFNEAEQPTLTAARTYTYNNLDHLQPTQQVMVNSQGEIITTHYKYPADFSTTVPYDLMLSKNIVTPVIEQEQYNDSEFLQSVKTNYATWNGTDIIAPASVETRHADKLTPEVRLQYHSYDSKGNIVSVSKKGDVPYAYLYDYNDTRAVAQIINAQVQDAAYTSFEADGKGNWVFNASAIGGGGYTGKKAFNLAGYSISRNDLTTSKTYILSYFHKNGTVTVGGGGSHSDIQTRALANGWTLVTRKITGTQFVSLSGTGVIDEVRLCPAEGQMTTYTYDLLTGITSVTDPNHTTSFYVYDDSNRLQLVKDDLGNVLKTYTYHFKQ